MVVRGRWRHWPSAGLPAPEPPVWTCIRPAILEALRSTSKRSPSYEGDSPRGGGRAKRIARRMPPSVPGRRADRGFRGGLGRLRWSRQAPRSITVSADRRAVLDGDPSTRQLARMTNGRGANRERRVVRAPRVGRASSDPSPSPSPVGIGGVAGAYTASFETARTYTAGASPLSARSRTGLRCSSLWIPALAAPSRRPAGAPPAPGPPRPRRPLRAGGPRERDEGRRAPAG